jgi:hypothetical protein
MVYSVDECIECVTLLNPIQDPGSEEGGDVIPVVFGPEGCRPEGHLANITHCGQKLVLKPVNYYLYNPCTKKISYTCMDLNSDIRNYG